MTPQRSSQEPSGTQTQGSGISVKPKAGQTDRGLATSIGLKKYYVNLKAQGLSHKGKEVKAVSSVPMRDSENEDPGSGAGRRGIAGTHPAVGRVAPPGNSGGRSLAAVSKGIQSKGKAPPREGPPFQATAVDGSGDSAEPLGRGPKLTDISSRVKLLEAGGEATKVQLSARSGTPRSRKPDASGGRRITTKRGWSFRMGTSCRDPGCKDPVCPKEEDLGPCEPCGPIPEERSGMGVPSGKPTPAVAGASRRRIRMTIGELTSGGSMPPLVLSNPPADALQQARSEWSSEDRKRYA
jgi:hypothetical protein